MVQYRRVLHALFCIFHARSCCFHEAREVTGECCFVLCCAHRHRHRHPLFWLIRWRDPAARQLSSAQLSPRGPRPQMRSCTARGSCSRRAPLRSARASADQAKTVHYRFSKKTRVLLAAAVNGSNDSLPRSGNYTSFLSEKWNYLTRLQRLLGPLHLVLKWHKTKLS